MKKVYIISRYRANNPRQLDFNKRVARYFCRMIIDEGDIPVAPHLFYTQFLNDDLELDREIGLNIGLKELEESDEFLLVIVDGVISEGMKREISSLSCKRGRIIQVSKEEMKEALKVIV